jgi:nucleotide-binding universal stress UspA family protein
MDATVIGVAARQPTQLIFADGCYVPPEVIDEDRDEADKEMHDAETEFRASIEVPDLQWRSSLISEMPSDYVVTQARCADLLLSGTRARKGVHAVGVTAGDLVMQTGRPVLVVPEAPVTLALDHVVLGWRDTRETRRAALDALPLIKRARHVTVMEIAAEDELAEARGRLADVALWLKRHGVVAETEASLSTDEGAYQLRVLAHAKGADLIVAGAYGHSRLREWALGGVTRNLLLQATCCTLLSH